MTALAAAKTGTEPRAAGNGDALLGYCMIAPIIVTMTALVFFPLAATVWDSLHRINPMQAGTPFIGLANYSRMFADADVGHAWTNTLIYVGIAVTIETVVGILAAALINQVKVGRQWLLAAVILPWALPGVVNSVIWLWIYQPGAGLLNGILTAFGLPFDNHVWFNDRTSALIAVVVVHIWRMMPLTIVIVLAAMQSIPGHLYEAAHIDGCGVWQAFWRVTLPLAAPGLAATAVLCFIFSWNDFFYALILTRTHAITAPVSIVNFLQYEGWEWTKVAAAGTLVMLPVVVFTVLVRTYLVRGLTAGGLKD